MALRLLKRCKWWYNYDMDTKRNGKILMAKSKEKVLRVGLFKKKQVTEAYDKENKKPVIKASICNGEQVAGFKDIHTCKIEEVMLIKNQADLDAFKKMYGIDGEIEKVY